MPAPGAVASIEPMERAWMERLVDAHLRAETAGDSAGCVAVYTDDVEHDLVGSPGGPVYGRAEAQRVHERLVGRIRTDALVPVRAYYGEDFCIFEHEWRASLSGTPLEDGHGRCVSLRVLHVWEFRDGLISRENVWLSDPAVLDQLSAAPAIAGVAP